MLLLIISACQTETIVEVEYTLPPEPIRQEIIIDENKITLKKYLSIIVYYDFLVQEWEAWGESIKKIILTENEK